eukprot:2191557-Pleurochrysis_carterae.AAC.1
MPSGSARLRSFGTCATEKETQGGAAKTASKSPSRTCRRTSAFTSGLARSWSRPPSFMSRATTFAPPASSSDASVERAV